MNTQNNINIDNINYKKSDFIINLKYKHHKIKDNRNILFMKHIYLKKIVNLFQISVIISSTIITFFESIKNHIHINDSQSQIIAILLSTYIAISTAIFKFIKIDDKKEMIFNVMQSFNDIECTIKNKIKKIELLQDRLNDDITFINSTTNSTNDNSYDSIIEIVNQHNLEFKSIIEEYNNEEIDKLILSNTKDFDMIFSYNELIYYKGKIVESMLLEKVHKTNRRIMEAPVDDLKENLQYIKDCTNEITLLKEKQDNIKLIIDTYNKDIENANIVFSKEEYSTIINHQQEVDTIENQINIKLQEIENMKSKSNKIFNYEDNLYNNNFCNNICLYFSNICHFCLIMNLYLSIAFKRIKLSNIHKNIDSEKYKSKDKDKDKEKAKFRCCKCTLFNNFVETFGCTKCSSCCMEKNKDEEENIVYCFDC